MSAVIICGNLSARRPGEATRNHPLPAERLRQAHSDFQSTGHGFRRAIFGHDAVARVRAGLGIVAARGCGSRKPGQSSPINFLGLGRALQPLQKPARAFANALHLPRSFRDAPASEMQEITEGIPDERKPTAPDGNLTARERKNAC